VLNVAVPPALSVAVPRMVVPLRKATVPVGIALPVCGATLAVKVTLCPVLIWVAVEVRVVVVATAPAATLTTTAAETELELAALPP
jgi:hypothetical protein